jgi:hypothetical protein
MACIPCLVKILKPCLRLLGGAAAQAWEEFQQRHKQGNLALDPFNSILLSSIHPQL